MRTWIAPLVLAALASPVARPAAAQPRASTVSGVVHDSIAAAPLARATVQIVAADDPARFSRTVQADAQGRFTIPDVPAGSYTLGFLHPTLDSLGIEPPARRVSVADGRPARVDLAIPSPARVRATICRPPGGAPVPVADDSSAVLVGVVRQAADGTPAAGVAVAGEWMELSIGRGEIGQRARRLVATTGPDGWFAICNVPRGGTMGLLASRGADSTAMLEVDVPPNGFLHRVLYLGAARRGTTPAERRADVGNGRLTGTVRAAVGDRPLEGAVVRVVNGPETRAGAGGEWSLAGVPEGTRTLEVRAVGFYPVHRPVDVVPDARPVRVALSTLKAVLDTVRVTANRYSRGAAEFVRRSRSGAGQYITPEMIARRQPIALSDLLRRTPGLRVDGVGFDATITMRGGIHAFASGDEDRCTPGFVVDGMQLPLSLDELDTWVQPKDLKGIEVYTAATVPGEFRLPFQDCGVIVIWTR